uniref:Uncharacterized protein n=1 Tax=Arundo donax TaxID=35708 RepID=A0A0A9B630_ARUDO
MTVTSHLIAKQSSLRCSDFSSSSLLMKVEKPQPTSRKIFTSSILMV